MPWLGRLSTFYDAQCSNLFLHVSLRSESSALLPLSGPYLSGWNKFAAECVTYTQLPAYRFAIYPCMIHKSLTVKEVRTRSQIPDPTSQMPDPSEPGSGSGHIHVHVPCRGPTYANFGHTSSASLGLRWAVWSAAVGKLENQFMSGRCSRIRVILTTKHRKKYTF